MTSDGPGEESTDTSHVQSTIATPPQISLTPEGNTADDVKSLSPLTTAANTEINQTVASAADLALLENIADNTEQAMLAGEKAVVPKDSATFASVATQSLPATPFLDCKAVFQAVNQTRGCLSCRYTNAVGVQNFTWLLTAPAGHGFVLDFNYMKMASSDFLTLYVMDNTSRGLLKNFSDDHFESMAPLLLRENQVEIVMHAYDKPSRVSLFNLTFSAFPVMAIPPAVWTNPAMPRESRVILNCSELTPGSLPETIRCDGIKQCLDGEDEADCPYYNQGCGDWFPYKQQCLKLVFNRTQNFKEGDSPATMPVEAEEICKQWGSTLATLPDQEMLNTVVKLIQRTGFQSAAVGLRRVHPVSQRISHLYRFLWQWGNRGSSIAYEQQTLQISGLMYNCAVLNVSIKYNIQPFRCVQPTDPFRIPDGYVCIKPNARNTSDTASVVNVTFIDTGSAIDKFPTKACPDGSLVQTFHRCMWGPDSHGLKYAASDWSPGHLPLFKCRFGDYIHYSLLCDGNDDCPDRSDEVNCQRPRFDHLVRSIFVCNSVQAVPAQHKCNGMADCFDGSDEEFCVCSKFGQVMCSGMGCVPPVFTSYCTACLDDIPQPLDPLFMSLAAGRVVMDGYGMARLVDVTQETDDECFPCQGGYCIPSFLLNNGEKDCPLGEDEEVAAADSVCPGYYRCHGVGTCVHRNYLCDDVNHCPNKDDEMYCHLNCPSQCQCEGYALTCSAMIHPIQHLFTRYLDLSGVDDVGTEDLHFMEFLTYLNLSNCGLSNVTLHDMFLLEVLDLSYNNIHHFFLLDINNLPGLLYLDLSHNPFSQSLGESFRALLLSSELHNLLTLIMYNNSLEDIQNGVFSPLDQLTHLDLGHNHIISYEAHAFYGLASLEHLHTDSPKLCCSYFHQTQVQCVAPVDELSSCDDLLALDFFRVFLWAIAILAIAGNLGVFLHRACLDDGKSAPPFQVLVKNLCISDLLMGLYVLMIGIADLQYKGVYVEKEREWTESAACIAAGLVCFVSCEVSAFVICLITLDRILVICFPLKKNLHLSYQATVIACAVVWVGCSLLAAVPLFARLDFYGLNGICLPLPITRMKFSGQTFAFSVFIVLNLILFVLIGTGQAVICLAIRRHSDKNIGLVQSRRKAEDASIARRLFLVVLTDFLCWFPIGLMGLLVAARGTPMPSLVYVWTAIFVLPANCALNPFLYTLNGALQKWREKKLEKRSKMSLNDLQTEVPKWKEASVRELMEICLRASSRSTARNVFMTWMGVKARSVGTLTVASSESGSLDGELDFPSTTTECWEMTSTPTCLSLASSVQTED